MSERATLRRTLRNGAYVLLVVVAGAALYLGSQPKPEPVDTVQISRGRLTVTVEDDGRTRVSDRYTLSAPISGSLARITLEPGDSVTVETVVAHISAMEAMLMDPRTRAQAESRLAAAVASQSRVHAEVTRAASAAEFAQQEQARQEAVAHRGLEQVVRFGAGAAAEGRRFVGEQGGQVSPKVDEELVIGLLGEGDGEGFAHAWAPAGEEMGSKGQDGRPDRAAL